MSVQRPQKQVSIICYFRFYGKAYNATQTNDLDSDIETHKIQMAKLDNKIDRYIMRTILIT